MNFKHLTDEVLEAETIDNVRHIKRCEIKLLYQLAEIERRRLYCKRGPTLFIYCTKSLGLPNACAQMRIDTMRAMKIFPQIEEKLVDGTLNMSNIARIEKFVRNEKRIGKIYSKEDRMSLLTNAEHKTTREVILNLVAISPKSAPREKRRLLSVSETEILTVVQNSTLADMDQLKALWSHKNPSMSDAELITLMTTECLKKADPAQKFSRKISLRAHEVPKTKTKTNTKAKAKVNTKAGENTRYIPADVKKSVWLRDKNKCTFPGCESTHLLQYDHIIPFSMGGPTSVENLRLRCHAHNQQAAIDTFGKRKMEQYMNKKPTSD